MSQERKSLRGTSGLRSPISHTHVLFSFPSLPFSTDSHFSKESPYSYLFLLILTSLVSYISSFRRRAGETKSDSYDSSKMRFDVPRLLLEAEGVVNDSNTRKRGGEREKKGRKRTGVQERSADTTLSAGVSFYRTCYLINVVLNFILYNNNNN